MLLVVDYGMGNLKSVFSAFWLFTDKVKISDKPEDVEKAEKIVIPGVGAFGKAVENLKRKGLWDILIDQKKKGKPIFGICLGFQILFERSDESPGVEGLSFLKGNVIFLGKIGMNPVPNMGWVETWIDTSTPIFKGLSEQEFFYYAHSFFVEPSEGKKIAHFKFNGKEICTGIWNDNVFGVQFHPEKSGKTGLKVIENFAKL